MPAPRCPICNTPLGPLPGGRGPRSDASLAKAGDAAAASVRPFCSARCKLVDLSKWLGEEYRVPGPALGDGGPLGVSDEGIE